MEELKALIEMVRSGMKLTAVAKRLGISKSEVHRIVAQLDVFELQRSKKPRITDEQRATIIELTKCGTSIRQIALMAKTSRDSVRRLRKEMGIQPMPATSHNCPDCGKQAEELGGFFECLECRTKWQR